MEMKPTQMNFANNFLKYKDQFYKDTGLLFNPQNMDTYIEYLKTVQADQQTQLLNVIHNDLFNIAERLSPK